MAATSDGCALVDRGEPGRPHYTFERICEDGGASLNSTR